MAIDLRKTPDVQVVLIKVTVSVITEFIFIIQQVPAVNEVRELFVKCAILQIKYTVSGMFDVNIYL